jgi:hypothetical protein
MNILRQVFDTALNERLCCPLSDGWFLWFFVFVGQNSPTGLGVRGVDSSLLVNNLDLGEVFS